MPITPSPAVGRACELLDILSRHPTEAFSISELARQAQTPRATCDSILQALAAGGLVVRRGDDLRYALGPLCVALGEAARAAQPDLAAARVETERLARATGTFSALAIRDGEEVRVADVFDFGPPFGLRARVGQSVPLVPPFGAVFVAWSEPDAARWIARGDDSLTTEERARYRAALTAVRRRGYSVSVATRRRSALADALDAVHANADPAVVRQARDEAIKEMMHSDYLPAELDGDSPVRVSQLSAPIFDHTGRVVASVMVLGPEHDLADREIRSIGEALVRAAQRAMQQADGAMP